MSQHIERRRRALVQLACSLAIVVFWNSAAGAAAPRVSFDTPYTAECRDVTPEAFGEANPELRIIEARFRVSTRLLAGREADLDEVLIEIASTDERLTVVDFMPRTELDTDIAGEIEVVENRERTDSTNAGLGGTVGIEYGLAKAAVTPSAGGGNTRHSGAKESYKRIPPKQLLLASGTIDRGHGVFFKLKPSSNASLEGMREFACLFVVPCDWTSDSVQVTCAARSAKKGYFSTQGPSCGGGTFDVGLYLEGDADGRAAAVASTRPQAPGSKPARHSFAGAMSITAFKPLVDQAVEASRGWHFCPPLRDERD